MYPLFGGSFHGRLVDIMPHDGDSLQATDSIIGISEVYVAYKAAECWVPQDLLEGFLADLAERPLVLPLADGAVHT